MHGDGLRDGGPWTEGSLFPEMSLVTEEPPLYPRMGSEQYDLGTLDVKEPPSMQCGRSDVRWRKDAHLRISVSLLLGLMVLCIGCTGTQTHIYPMLPQYAGEHLGPEATIRYVEDRAELNEMKLRVKDGLLVDRQGRPLDPQVDTHPNRDGFAIFVMDTRKTIYLSFDHQQDRFHHSSILAGAPVSAAGDMTILNGKLLGISNSSGHYRPRGECIERVLLRLQAMGVDVSGVQISRIGPDGQRRYLPSRVPNPPEGVQSESAGSL